MMEEEKLDVLDENGEFTGQRASRTEVHEKGLWHRVVHVWVVNSKGELIIQKRHRTKINFPSLYDVSAAGHCVAGDDSVTSALRELEEELGIKANKEQLQYILTAKLRHVLNNGTYINNEFVDVYLIHMDVNLNDLKLQESEVEEVKYIHWTDLQKRLLARDPAFVPINDGWEEHLNKFFSIIERQYPSLLSNQL